ncbi:MAG TPA: ATP-binding protein [Nevskiaceae bacterium]|nr:ATP-binding protein [Nevskiaceae bacterium]
MSLASPRSLTRPPPLVARAGVDSDGLFRRLVEGVSDYAIYMLDLDGRICSWNLGAQRFKGYTEPEVIGQHFSMFYRPVEREEGRPQRALGTALREGRFEGSGWRLRKDGSQFWAHVIIDRIDDERGEPVGFAKITRDISERRSAELRTHDLLRINEELEQFVHIASHDLREPLRKVLAFSDLLMEEHASALGDQGQAHLRSIQNATRRMQALLASLLDLTRVTSAGRSFDPCPLGPLAEEVCADLELMIREHQAQIRCEALPEIEADPRQMRQLLQNLIENAVKYAHPQRPPQIGLRAIAASQSGFAAFEVTDNGIGFEPQYAERIFGIFQRLHGRDRYPGAGIGLSVCRKICERHGGQIRAEGRPGEGARFIVELPQRHRPDGI